MFYKRFLMIMFWICLLGMGLGIFGFNTNLVLADDPPTTSLSQPMPLVSAMPTSKQGPWVVRAYYTTQQQINELAAWREPWEVNKIENYVVVEVLDWFEYLRLQNMGFVLVVDEKLTQQYSTPNRYLANQLDGIPGYPCYRTVEETFNTAEEIVNNHPNLAQWIDIGDSWEKTTPGGNAGYDVMVLKLTNSATLGPKPKIFIMTALHAREYTTAELNTRFAEYLINNYGTDADVTWLLDYNEFHLLLQSNPDGRKHAEGGAYWRKNTNENYCGPTSSNRGADLNRNFEFQWDCCGGSSGDPCDTTYRGPSPASEPETQAIQNYVESIFPDLRPDDLDIPAPITTTGVFLDIHSSGELILWPWGFTNNTAPNGTALQTLGRKFAYFNDYYPEQAIGLYPTDGTTDDFGYGKLGLPAYTFELGTSFFQDCSSFENTIVPDNIPALVYAAKAAHRPYLTPAGPDALDVTVSPVVVVAGEGVSLTVTLNDTLYNNQNGTEPTQNIAAAVYYIDSLHWITDTPITTYTLSPTDGTYDSPVESAQATIDTTSLSSGRHTIFVRAQDANGNWGAYSAAFLYIAEPGVSPIMEGYVRSMGSNMPLNATLSADIFHTNTNPTTGYYSMTVVSDTYNLTAVSAGYAISTVTNIPAYDYQTIQQDFYLYPVCDVLNDNVESGNQGWIANSPWAIVTEAAHSPTHSWTDSPGGEYGNNLNISLTSSTFDLTDYENITLSFWHIYDLEDGYDYAYLEYSTDGGSTWTTAATYNGENPTPVWTQETVSLPNLSGQANVKIRFRLDTDGSVTEDGWHIDDIVLSGGGPICITDSVPIAEFTSNSPVALGTPIEFTNLTTAMPTATYFWDFGDALGTSTQTNPAYTYAATGTFTVTLVASNTLGTDSISHTVTILTPTYNVTVSVTPAMQNDLPGQNVTYTLHITNLGNTVDAYTLNLTDYTWPTTLAVTTTNPLNPLDSTQLALTVAIPLTATFPQSDSVTVIATSQTNAVITASKSIITTVACEQPHITSLSSNSPVYLGETVNFSSTVSSQLPLSYTWDFGGPGVQGGNSDETPTFIYDQADIYTATLQINNNCQATDMATTIVTVYPFEADISITPIAFTKTLTATFSSTDTISISNLGFASLDWFVTSTPPVTWLTTSPISGSIAALSTEVVQVDFDATTLTAGYYSTTLLFASNDPDTPVLSVPVSLTVISNTVNTTPTIAIDPLAFNVTLNENEVFTNSLSISNTGTATLNWVLTNTTATSWLTPAFTTGSVLSLDSELIDIVFDATNLLTGSYTATLMLNSNDPLNAQLLIPVTLTVLTEPCPDIAGLNFSYTPTTPISGEPIVFAGFITEGSGVITYTWQFDSLATESGQTVTYAFPQSTITHTYAVTLTAVNNCFAEASISQDITVAGHGTGTLPDDGVYVYLPLIIK